MSEDNSKSFTFSNEAPKEEPNKNPSNTDFEGS